MCPKSKFQTERLDDVVRFNSPDGSSYLTLHSVIIQFFPSERFPVTTSMPSEIRIVRSSLSPEVFFNMTLAMRSGSRRGAG